MTLFEFFRSLFNRSGFDFGGADWGKNRRADEEKVRKAERQKGRQAEACPTGFSANCGRRFGIASRVENLRS
jgi:hypothetical protein